MKNMLCAFAFFMCFCVVCFGIPAANNEESRSLLNIRPRRQIIYYRPINPYYPQRVQYVYNPYYVGAPYRPQYTAWDLSSRKRRETLPSDPEQSVDAEIALQTPDYIRGVKRYDAIDHPSLIEQTDDHTSNPYKMRYVSRRKRQVSLGSDNTDDNGANGGADRVKPDPHYTKQRYSMWDLSRKKRQTNRRAGRPSKGVLPHYTKWDLSSKK